MNRALVLSLAIGGFCLSGKADTNNLPLTCPLYSLPALQLRSFALDSELEPQPQVLDLSADGDADRLSSALANAPQTELRTETALASDATGLSPKTRAGLAATSTALLSQSSAALATEDLELTFGQSQFFRQVYRRLDEGGYLTKPEVKSDSLLARFADSFEPEVIRLGKTTTLSCSLITAIKHKNPLCLINPYFLVLSW